MYVPLIWPPHVPHEVCHQDDNQRDREATGIPRGTHPQGGWGGGGGGGRGGGGGDGRGGETGGTENSLVSTEYNAVVNSNLVERNI